MKTIYRIDKFTDFNGVEREFIIAAVSVDTAKDCKDKFIDETFVSLSNDIDVWDIKAPKLLLLGIAVRNVNDTYDEELGMRIALGKALKVLEDPTKQTGKIIAVSDKGIINSAVVDAILDQEAAYFKRNPASYIAHYGKKAKKQNHTNRTNNYIFNYFLVN